VVEAEVQPEAGVSGVVVVMVASLPEEVVIVVDTEAASVDEDMCHTDCSSLSGEVNLRWRLCGDFDIQCEQRGWKAYDSDQRFSNSSLIFHY